MAPTPQQTRERLEAIRERTRRARDQRAAAIKAQHAAREAGDQQAFQTATAAHNEAQTELELAQALENKTLQQLAGARPDFGAALASNVEALSALQEIANTTAQMGTRVIAPIMDMEGALALFGRALSGPFAAPVNLPDFTGRRGDFDGIAATPTPGLTLLDFWPSKPLENKTTDYLRRNGVPAAVDPTAEGAVKPEVPTTYSSEQAQAETFAGWVKVQRQQVDDVDELMPDLQAVIRYAVLRGVENVLINGNAVFDMDGIQSVSGVLAPVLTGLTNLGDAAAAVFRDLRSSGVEPTFIAVSPAAYTAEQTRKASGSGEYIGLIRDGRIWDVPIVQSNGLTGNELVAGDAEQAGYIGVRQPPTLSVSDSDQDDFLRNRLTARVEGRFVPVIKVPSALAVGTFPAA